MYNMENGMEKSGPEASIAQGKSECLLLHALFCLETTLCVPYFPCNR